MSTITAELVEKDAKIKLPTPEGIVDALIYDKDDNGETVDLWFTSTPSVGDLYTCDPAEKFVLVEQAPVQMTLPELVREFTAIRVAIATDQPYEHRRLYIIVDELRSRGGLD